MCAAAAPVILPAVFWRIAKLPLTATPWKDLAYVSLGLASGIFALTFFFVGPFLSILLIITLIGIPKLLLDMWLTQWWANGERLRGHWPASRSRCRGGAGAATRSCSACATRSPIR